MFRQERQNLFWSRFCSIYVKENIASKLLNLHLDKEIEAVYFEINIPLKKMAHCRFIQAP